MTYRGASYQELLNTPEWKKRRTYIISIDNNTCQFCGSSKGIKHVHHRYYMPNRRPWEYPDATLVTLCERCHIDEHMWKALYKECFPEVMHAGYSYKDLYEFAYLLIEVAREVGFKVSVRIIRDTLNNLKLR